MLLYTRGLVSCKRYVYHNIRVPIISKNKLLSLSRTRSLYSTSVTTPYIDFFVREIDLCCLGSKNTPFRDPSLPQFSTYDSIPDNHHMSVLSNKLPETQVERSVDTGQAVG